MTDNMIAVSIVCNAYNHEKYIRNALEGFVMQKTTFPFEVLIHDDASTDGTAAIIREYEKKYPEIIKPIYESENLYSKGDGSLARVQYGRVKGKYIALCEGDDYWIDPLKLQKQYNALEAHPELDICTCAAVTERNGQRYGMVALGDEDQVIPVETLIPQGGGIVATASIMYRTSIRENPLPFFYVLRLDYTLQILGSLRGGMLYLAEPMVVYRLATDGSWTQRMYQNPSKKIEHLSKVILMVRQLDVDTDGKYHGEIETKIQKKEFEILRIRCEYRALLSKRFREIYRDQSIKEKMIIILGALFPKSVDILKILRDKVL